MVNDAILFIADRYAVFEALDYIFGHHTGEESVPEV